MPVERVVPPRSPAGIALSLFAALALVALVACGGERRVTASPAKLTPTTSPAGLSWRTLTMPQGYDPRTEGLSGVGVVKANAANAAVCVIPTQGVPAIPQVWTTHDAGATWTPTGALTGVTPVSSCSLRTDDFDPTIMLLGAGNTASSGGYTLLTVDGGTTWQPYAADAAILEFATVNGMTYATRQAQSGPDQREHLAVSIDHFQTWQNIDGDIVAANKQLHSFWLNPATGDLLAEAYDVVTTMTTEQPRPHLWKSGDLGAHWTPLADQQLDFFTVQQPSGATDWRICGSTEQRSATATSAPAATEAPTATTAPAATGTRIACTSDGGATWTTIAPPDGVTALQLVGVTRDGSVLARAGGTSASESALYLLADGSSTWTQQGKVPQSFVQCGITSDGTLLWAFPLNGAVTDDAGDVYVAQV